MLIRKLENFVEGQIEGFFNKKFSSSLQIEEIENRLEKEFYLKKREVVGKVYMPDVYTVIVGDSDYDRLNCPETFLRLYRFILQSAIRKAYFFTDKIALRLSLNAIKDPGCFSVQALYQDDQPVAVAEKKPAGDLGVDQTIVFQKNCLPKGVIDYSQVLFARLRVIEGADASTVVEIGERRVHIGRRESNEVPLQDKNCSRLHAYIDFENCRHVICDAESLNGTSVNRQFTRRCALRPGDQISLGNTVIVYEVD